MVQWSAKMWITNNIVPICKYALTFLDYLLGMLNRYGLNGRTGPNIPNAKSRDAIL